MKIIVVIAICLLFSGCGIIAGDLAVQRKINSGELHLGLSLSAVEGMVGHPLYGCTKTRYAKGGTLEMWDFASRRCSQTMSMGRSFAYVFENGILIEIRVVTSMQDLQF